MLCCLRSSGGPTAAELRQKRIHDQIEKGTRLSLPVTSSRIIMICTELRGDVKRRQRQHRVLLLGCGEAGKSTFIKQMRIIHSGGFTDKERLELKADIAANIVSAIQTLLQNTRGGRLDADLEDDARYVLQ